MEGVQKGVGGFRKVDDLEPMQNLKIAPSRTHAQTRQQWAEDIAGIDGGEMFKGFARSDSLHTFSRLIKKEDYGDDSILRGLTAEGDEGSDYYSLNLEGTSLPGWVVNASQCEKSFLLVVLDPFRNGELKETDRYEYTTSYYVLLLLLG